MEKTDQKLVTYWRWEMAKHLNKKNLSNRFIAKILKITHESVRKALLIDNRKKVDEKD